MGLAAGTPIWTETGLVLVESLTVGDHVLSQRLDADGEPVSTRIVRVGSSDDNDLSSIDLFRARVGSDPDDPGRFECSALFMDSKQIIGERSGWRMLQDSMVGIELRLIDGSICQLFEAEGIRQCLTKEGKIIPGFGFASNKDRGYVIDFRSGAPALPPNRLYNLKTAGEGDEGVGCPIWGEHDYKARTYSLVVEGGGCYFIGDWGLRAISEFRND